MKRLIPASVRYKTGFFSAAAFCLAAAAVFFAVSSQTAIAPSETLRRIVFCVCGAAATVCIILGIAANCPVYRRRGEVAALKKTTVPVRGRVVDVRPTFVCRGTGRPPRGARYRNALRKAWLVKVCWESGGRLFYAESEPFYENPAELLADAGVDVYLAEPSVWLDGFQLGRRGDFPLESYIRSDARRFLLHSGWLAYAALAAAILLAAAVFLLAR